MPTWEKDTDSIDPHADTDPRMLPGTPSHLTRRSVFRLGHAFVIASSAAPRCSLNAPTSSFCSLRLRDPGTSSFEPRRSVDVGSVHSSRSLDRLRSGAGIGVTVSGTAEATGRGGGSSSSLSSTILLISAVRDAAMDAGALKGSVAPFSGVRGTGCALFAVGPFCTCEGAGGAPACAFCSSSARALVSFVSDSDCVLRRRKRLVNRERELRRFDFFVGVATGVALVPAAASTGTGAAADGPASVDFRLPGDVPAPCACATASASGVGASTTATRLSPLDVRRCGVEPLCSSTSSCGAVSLSSDIFRSDGTYSERRGDALSMLFAPMYSALI
eukprot:Opistho-1_new@33693